jgi:ABC-type Zn uptake system ZnuABC Zn-binding protein ZnuA
MPRHQLIFGLVAVVIVSLSVACGDNSDDGDEGGADGNRPLVVATTTQIEALTREVAGDLVSLEGILPAGADAHEFEPTASDLVAIEGAQLILRHGIGLDEWLDDTIEAGSSATVATVTEGIELQEPALEHAHEEEEEHAEEDETAEGGERADEGEATEEDEHADDEEGLDPHVWHDPDRVKTMVLNIAAALGEADPDNAATYDTNAAAYNEKLDQTKAEVQALIDEIPADNRKLVTNHDAFGYFASAFGLEIVGAVIPSTSTEAEPSAEETAELLETIEHEGVKAIFAESSVNPDLARTLAQDAGVAIVDDLYGDSLGESGSGAETVDGMLLANAQKIADALR